MPADGAEHLQPESTANPALHRFFAFMAARALDPDAGLPAQDLQVQHTLSCPFGHTHQAQAALDQLPQQFSVKQQVSNVCKLKRTRAQSQMPISRGQEASGKQCMKKNDSALLLKGCRVEQQVSDA